MTLPYTMRLLCLCLQVLFLVHLAGSALVLSLSGRLTRAAATMRPQRAAQLLLGMRLLPFGCALGVVALLCAPSYLRFEDNLGAESMGPACLAMAVLGAGICLNSLARASRALGQLRHLQNTVSVMQALTASINHTPDHTPLCISEQNTSGSPLLVLVGILRPRLIMSRRLLDALSFEQLQAVLSHERAHLLSRDNLKRLLIALTPGALPFAAGFAALERQWARYAELAADDHAAQSHAGHALALAEALLHVARLANDTCSLPLASSLSDSNLDLAHRVNRLLAANAPSPARTQKSRSSREHLIAIIALLTALLILLPKLSAAIYPLLETLLH